jgi:hypothetical protein
MMGHSLANGRTPRAVAIDVSAKPRVRLSVLKNVNTADLINAALEYQQAASSDASVTTFPAALGGHVTGTSPKRRRGAA